MKKYDDEELKKMLFAHKVWLMSGGEHGIRFDLSKDGNANLVGANLRGVDLKNANLRGANLRNADLKDADLRGANLTGADLSNADLRNANLRGADLSNANIDFSCWSLSCKSLTQKIDLRIARQLFYHAYRAAMSCEDEGVKELLGIETLKNFVNGSHCIGVHGCERV